MTRQMLRNIKTPVTIARTTKPGGRPKYLFGICITVAAAVFLIVQLSHHVMWRDELRPWPLATSSRTLFDLFQNLHYEGHPGLWHLLLWLASSISPNIVTIKVVDALIGIAIFAMIGVVSPFSRLEKALLLLNYFVIFEFTVISRNYGIALLLALIYAQLRAAFTDRTYIIAITLGLLANTNVFGTILSIAFAIEYLIDQLMNHRNDLTSSAVRIGPPALLYLLLLALAVATMAPAADISWKIPGIPFSHPSSLSAIKTIILSYLEFPLLPPLRLLKPVSENATFFSQVANIPVLAFFILWVGVIYTFRNDRDLLLMIGLTALGSVAFGYAVYLGSMRHWSINFIAVLAALWIQRIRRPHKSVLVLIFLLVGAVTGIGASAQVWYHYPFSNSAAAATWLTDQNLEDAALVGTYDDQAAAVAMQLGRPMYYLDCSCSGTYLKYTSSRDLFDDSQIPDRLAMAVSQIKKRPIVFVVTHQLSDRERNAIAQRQLNVIPLAQFVGSQRHEDFWLYQVDQLSVIMTLPNSLP